jgi:hypothetical protein
MTFEATFLALPEDPTFNVWRIENFNPVPWTDLGAFYTGDSYIVLWAKYAGGGSKRVVRDIFFWIGSESSQDEYGAAAIKTVELDDRFGGEPTQHREIQYHESELFHKAFEPYGGVRYLSGGVPSGFKPVDLTQGVNLYQVKGRRRPVLLKVPATASSLNHGDAFILTSDKELFMWVGKGANVAEKVKATHVLDTLAARFRGVPRTRLDNSATSPEFWALLGGEGPIASADAAGADDAIEAAYVTKIYKAAGEAFSLFAEGPKATVAILTNPPGTLIIERGEQIVVFLPKTADAAVKKTAVELGVKFLKAQKLPLFYSVTVAKEGVKDETLDIIFA